MHYKRSTYSLRHCDLVQLQGLRGLLGGEDSGELLYKQQSNDYTLKSQVAT